MTQIGDYICCTYLTVLPGGPSAASKEQPLYCRITGRAGTSNFYGDILGGGIDTDEAVEIIGDEYEGWAFIYGEDVWTVVLEAEIPDEIWAALAKRRLSR